MSLYAELRRRKVFKVGGAYLVVAWLLIQVAATVAPQLQLRDWAPRMLTLVLLLGFPVALVLAWALDSTPGRSRHTVGSSDRSRCWRCLLRPRSRDRSCRAWYAHRCPASRYR